MKVTPLDIRRKEFKRSMRGYSDEEVDIFLDEVADEFERLFQENMEMQDRIHLLEEQIAGHVQIRDALEKTLISAQLQSDEIRANARKEGELILRDAELKARHVVNDSYGETQRVQQALIQLKHLEEDFRFKFRSLLEGHLNLLTEAPITVRSTETLAPASAPVSETEAPLIPEAPESEAPQAIVYLLAAEETVSSEPITEEPEVELPAAGVASADNTSSGPEDDVPTEETALGVEEVSGADPMAAELVAELAGFGGEVPALAVDAPGADSAVDAAAEQTDATGEAIEDEPQLGGFFFGRKLDSDEDFTAPEAGKNEKGRDFEW